MLYLLLTIKFHFDKKLPLLDLFILHCRKLLMHQVLKLRLKHEGVELKTLDQKGKSMATVQCTQCKRHGIIV